MKKTSGICLLLFAACILSAECVFQVKSSAFANLEFGRKPQKITLIFRNNGTFSGPCQELIRLTDALGNNGTTRSSEFVMKPETGRSAEILVPAERKGAFRIRYSLLRQGQLIFTKEVRGGNYPPVVWQDPDHALLGCYAWALSWHGKKVLPILKNIGIPWIRTIVNWRQAEKKQGDFRFEKFDRTLNLLKEMDFRIFVNYERSPDWAHRLFEDKNNWKMFAQRAEMMAKRYPQVRVWEVWNEPDFKQDVFGVDTGKGVAEMLKEFYPAVKRGNPNALVAASGCTGDRSARLRSFLDSFYRHGGGNCFDVCTFHYGSRNVNLEFLRKYHCKKPVWNTEDSPYNVRSASKARNAAGYIIKTAAGAAEGVSRSFYFLSNITVKTASEREEMDPVRLLDNDFLPMPNLWMLRTFANEVNGFRFVSELKMKQGVRAVLFENRKTQKLLSILWRTPEGPRTVMLKNPGMLETVDPFGREEKFFSCSGMSSLSLDLPVFLHGKAELAEQTPFLLAEVPAAKFLPGEKSSCRIVLHNPGAKELCCTLKTAAPAHWKTIPPPVPLRLAPGETRTELLTVQPDLSPDEMEYQLIFQLFDGEQLIAEDSATGIMIPPVVGELVPAFRDGEKRVILQLSNRSSAAFSGKAVLMEGKNQERAFRIPGGKTIPLEFIPDLPGNSGTVTLQLHAENFHRIWTKTLQWNAIFPEGVPQKKIVLNTRDHFKSTSLVLWRWNGPDDLSAVTQLCWTPQSLVFTAEVADDVHYHPAETPSWQQDSLQFCLNGAMYIAALTAKGAQFRREDGTPLPRGSSAEITRKNGKTVYRIRIGKPDGAQWSVNDRIRFGFIINDTDVNGDREGWLYSPGANIGDPRDRNRLTEFVLAAGESPVPESSSTVAPGSSLDPARWKPHSPAVKKTVMFRNGALEFYGYFAPGTKDRWFYPVYKLTPQERRCRYLTFRIRAEQKPLNSGFSNVQFWLSSTGKKQKACYIFKKIGPVYREITVDLHTKWKEPELPEKLNIGLGNRNDDEVTMFLSELRFHNGESKKNLK